MQSRLASFVETITNIAIGFAVSLLVNALLLPALGHNITATENITITVVFTVVSIVRSYIVRRLFNSISTKQRPQ